MMPLQQALKKALERCELRALDLQFGRFLARQQGSETLQLAGVLVSEALSQGHSCLPLDSALAHYGTQLHGLYARLQQSALQSDGVLLGDGTVLAQSGAVTPLVLDNGALYLYRYWQYERQVAKALLGRTATRQLDAGWLRQALDRLFGAAADGTAEPDWQRVAAAVALSHPLAVISGGPGTGKTTTVVKMLALWLERALLDAGEQGKARAPVIRLAAPTGKAAARLAESIVGARDKLDIDESIRELIPDHASTLHRLLGSLPNTRRFRHHRDNPLHLDLLVVDEASMVDLPLMARLLDALPDGAQLLLIGDRDQLASVEAGGVLADIAGRGEPLYSPQQMQQLVQSCQLIQGCQLRQGEIAQPGAATPIADSLALLRKSYRFHADSGIGHLARAVNAGDNAQCLKVFKQQYDDIAVQTLNEASYPALIAQAVEGYRDYLQQAQQEQSAEAVLQAFGRCQLLCALREGRYGVEGLNEAIEKALQRAGLISLEGLWYSGRPVIITRNDPALGLYNGDIGIALPNADGQLRVWFEQREEPVLPSRLPSHQTVYAMTIHKSQGSEFDRVLMVLPEQDNPVLTRELVYTGITRAKVRCEIYGSWAIMSAAVARATRRSSGLAGLLWGESLSERYNPGTS
ncbi:MAG: exodeoxyribonuclease V subunit alpha [Marinobacterium sp.]|nr:exodeoxyribonuclease V subunit alpha [Marinobacterium sp.]